MRPNLTATLFLWMLIASVGCKPSDKENPLLGFIVNNDEGGALRLLHNDGNIGGRFDVRSLRNRQGSTSAIEGASLLHIAAFQGQTSVVSALLERGADVDARSKLGSTALHPAAFNGHIETVETLIRAGANVNAADKRGITPLILAASSGRSQVVRLLLDAGGEADSMAESGATPLVTALLSDLDPSDRAKLASSQSQWLALKHTSRPEVVEIIDLLVDAGADPDKGYPLSAVTVAIMIGDHAATDLLLPKSKHINGKLPFGATLLHVAVARDDEEMVSDLLKMGARTNISDSDGKVPISYATSESMRSLLK